MVKGDKEDPLHAFAALSSRQACEQYFTSSQFFAHFLRHSKGRAQRTQIFGAKPFFTRAPCAITHILKALFGWSALNADHILSSGNNE